MKKELNFNEFQPVSEKQWKQKIQADLKGADYNEKLLTDGPAGTHIKPIYHRDSAPEVNVPPRATGNWYVSQKIYVASAKATNAKLLDIFQRGAEGAVLVMEKPTIDVEQVFQNVPEQYGIQVHIHFFDQDFLDKIKKHRPKAYVHLDPIHHLVTDGNWITDRKTDMQNLHSFWDGYDGYFGNVTVTTKTYTNGGANEIQELAYFLAHLNEYLNELDGSELLKQFSRKAKDNNAPKRINVDTSIGSNYFYQIAKFRAYRILANALGKEYGLDGLPIYLSAYPSPRNKSLLDYNVNLLRTTTECMSAVNGGVDTIYNLEYDAFFNKSNEFAERIARNQLLVLKEEAYLDKVENVADGSYFIDSLTKEFTEKALELFKQIEQGGGLIAQLHEGKIQSKVKQEADKEKQALKNGDKVLLGVNRFENKLQDIKPEYGVLPFVKIKPRKTLIAPIITERLAESFEKEAMRALKNKSQ